MDNRKTESISFRGRTLNAGSWSLAGLAGRTVVSTILFAILAQKIGPELYGLIGMILVISNFAMVVLEAGFTSALIQIKVLEERHSSSVFWVNVVLGLTLGIAFAVGSPLIAAFYGRPVLVPLTIYLSTIFVIASLNMVQRALLTRDLNLRAIALAEIISTTVAGVVAIIMAWNGHGVWSIATQSVVAAASMTILFWWFSNWRPKLMFELSAVLELTRFSTNFLATQSLNYWVRNLDKILIGKFLGDWMLGLYGRSYQLMLLPVRNLSTSISRVLFPSFSQIQVEHQRIAKIFLQSCRVISLLSFPTMLGICAIAYHMVSVILGDKWMEMVPVLRILCFVGAIQSVSFLIGSLYLSQGRTDLQFRVTLGLRIVSMIAIVIGLQWGITGVASCYLAAVVINQFPNFYFAGGLVGLRFVDYVRNLIPTMLAALVMFAAVFSCACTLDGVLENWILLMIEIPLGVIVYGLTLVLFKVKAFGELTTIAREKGVPVPSWI